MDHVLAFKLDLHWLVLDKIKLVDACDIIADILMLPVLIVKLLIRPSIIDIPLELTGLDHDRGSAFGILGLILDLRPQIIAEDREKYQDDGRDSSPDDLKLVVAVRVDRFAALLVTILDEEVNEDELDVTQSIR
jgi:hypothetical protein